MIQTSMTGASAVQGATKAAAPDPAAAAAKATERASLEKAAKAFEAIFTRQLMANMRGASLGEGIDDSAAVDQFREMSEAKMADGLAEKGGLGIAQLLLSQLDKKS